MFALHLSGTWKRCVRQGLYLWEAHTSIKCLTGTSNLESLKQKSLSLPQNMFPFPAMAHFPPSSPSYLVLPWRSHLQFLLFLCFSYPISCQETGGCASSISTYFLSQHLLIPFVTCARTFVRASPWFPFFQGSFYLQLIPHLNITLIFPKYHSKCIIPLLFAYWTKFKLLSLAFKAPTI